MDRTRRGGGGRADGLVLLAAMAINMAPSLRADETAAKAAGPTFDAARAGGAGVGEGIGLLVLKKEQRGGVHPAGLSYRECSKRNLFHKEKHEAN